MKNGKITISRVRLQDGRDILNMRLKDENSSTNFLELEIKPEDLMLALTGFAEQEMEYSLAPSNKLEKLGKELIVETLEFSLGLEKDIGFSERKNKAMELASKYVKEGYTPDLYFDAQYSFFTKNNELWARTFQRTYVEPK